VELSNRLQQFFGSFGVTKYGSLFTLDGEVINSNHRAGLVSTNAVMSLAATHPLAKEFVEDFWNQPVPQVFGDRYYDGTLYMLNLLQCSGKYKIWMPKQE
jgi:oligosaccharide reducing-end xylanase